MLPGIVQARLRPSADQPIEPSRAASENVVALAIECSKPDPMNASSAHHTRASLAPSDRVRAAIHSARHTRALHSTARQNSCGPPAASFVVTIVATRSDAAPDNVPPAWTAAASSNEPARLPASDATATAATRCGPVTPRHQPCSMNITLPVNSSAPAKITRVRASPNTAPWTSRAAPDPAATSGALTDTSNTIAKPTYTPARADDAR